MLRGATNTGYNEITLIIQGEFPRKKQFNNGSRTAPRT